MAITRTEQVTIAEASGDNDGGVELALPFARLTLALSIAEAEQLGRELLAASMDAHRALREEKYRDDVSHDENAF